MPSTGKRTYNVRRIKQTRLYSVQEIGKLFDLHKNAEELIKPHVIELMRTAVLLDLQPIDDRKPYMIRGNVLADFLRQRQQSRKCKCAPDQFYCCKCRAPRKASLGMVDALFDTPTKLRLIALCEQCSTAMHKNQSAENLPALHKIFQIRTLPPKYLSDCVSPTVNSDMR